MMNGNVSDKTIDEVISGALNADAKQLQLASYDTMR
jgi:hypothetical protein